MWQTRFADNGSEWDMVLQYVDAYTAELKRRGLTEAAQPTLGAVVSAAEAVTEQITQQAIETASVGPFGEIYTQFKGKPQEAVTFLLAKRSGEAIGALHHKDIGDIDLVWSKEGTAHSDGYGLAKLAKFHPEVLFNLQG